VDYCCGLPYNITSYALLTYMIAQVCDLKAKELIIAGGDIHVYKTHIDNARVQLTRSPYNFPKLKLNKDVKDIDKFTYDDFEILDYKCHPTLKFEMAI
jgi:thymidylate synthase